MVYIILGKGFEPVEAIAPCDILRRGGVDVKLAGIGGKTVEAAHAAVSFARGFFALYAGEVVGIALGNAIELVQPGAAQPYAVAACAGLASLFAYLFLFTERDYIELTAIAGGIDAFDEACRRIAEDAALSKREAEVLPLALRGRTAERIAGELCIAKSTADTHLRRIYSTAGVHSRQELLDKLEEIGR